MLKGDAMRSLVQIVIDAVSFTADKIKFLVAALWEKFLEINIFEKGIVIATALSFAASAMPMAKYKIFDAYFTINNPDVHYCIVITAVMLITVYFPGMMTTVARVLLNILYLADIIYLAASRSISKAPYAIAVGYYLNLVVPVVYIILAVGSYFTSDRH